MATMYHKSVTEISVKDFKLLMEKLQEEYNKSWRAVVGESKESPPRYDDESEKVSFLGYKDKEREEAGEDISISPSLDFLMRQNERVQACLKQTNKKTWSRKYLYNKLREVKELKDSDTLKFQSPCNYIFFEYIGLSSYEEFRAKFPEDVAETVGKKKDWSEFYILALKLSEQRVDRLELHINFDQNKLIIVDDKGEQCGKGTVQYQPDFLEIRLDRMDKQGRTWLPSTAYFKWDGTLEDIEGIAGTYNGVSSTTKRTVAATCVIVRKEQYDNSKQDIAHYLFLKGYAVDVITPIYAKEEGGGFLPIQEDRKILQEFIGNTEVYIIDRDHVGTISQYVMKIEPELFGFLYSPHDRNKYLLAMRASSNVIFFDISHIDPNDGVKFATKTSMLTVNRRNKKVINDSTVIYQAASTGMNRDKNWLAFPVLLVVNPPNTPKTTLIKKKNLDAFLNTRGREELNKEIIRKLYEMETSRLGLVDNMLGDILSDL